MTIKRFLHSCLLFEKEGQKLLIDPGMFSFGEDGVKVSDIGPVDFVIVTHSHRDHFFPDALKVFHQLKPFKLLTTSEIAEQVKELGIEPLDHHYTPQKLGVFDVVPFQATHEALPFPVPENLGVVIDNHIAVTGDSYTKPPVDVDLLFLTYSGPFATLTSAVNFALNVHLKTIVPIHDFMNKQFYIDMMHDRLKVALKDANIEVRTLNLGEEITI